MIGPKDLSEEDYKKMVEEINQNASVPTLIYFPELGVTVDTEEK